MEEYNEIFKDILMSNKVKHLIELEPSIQNALENLEIIHVNLANPERYFFYVLQMIFTSQNIEILRIEKDYNKNFVDDATPVRIKIDGVMYTLQEKLDTYFPELNKNRATRDKQIEVIGELLEEVFRIIHSKIKSADAFGKHN